MEQYSNGMALVPCSDPTILKVCSTAEAECQTEGIIYELEEREEPTLNESVIGRDENSTPNPNSDLEVRSATRTQPELNQKHSDWQTVVGAKTENLSQDSEMIEINFNRQSSDGALTTPTMMSSTIMTSSVMASSMDPDTGRKLSVQSLPSNPSPIQSDADRKPV